MNKPYIICHMLQSIDGRIAGHFFQDQSIHDLAHLYQDMSREYHADALIYGSVTVNELFTHDTELNLENLSGQKIDRKDFICLNEKSKWLVVIDPLGTLGWTLENLKHPRLKDRNVVEVLSHQVSQQYLAYLRSLGISYIFAGEDQLSMTEVVQKLKKQFNIETALLQGGGLVNEAFANEDLIDEISLIIAPIIDGESHVPTTFESGQYIKSIQCFPHFTLSKTKVLNHSGLWINYLRTGKKEER